MDARVCARPGCGNPLLPGRKLEDFLFLCLSRPN